MRTAPLVLLLSLQVACGRSGGGDEDEVVELDDASLYESDAFYDDVESNDFALNDPARDRDINIRVRTSPSAPQPYPLVLVSHGGENGNANGHTALSGWAEGLAAYGYAVVNIAHTKDADPTWHCEALGIPEDECDEESDFGEGGTITSYHYDRPLDVSFVLSEVLERAEEFGVEVDEAQIGMLGHSYGAWTTDVIAGMTLDFSPSVTSVSLADDRVRCFVSNSPPAVVGSIGVSETSFDTVLAPILYTTGAGDTNSDASQTPETRKDAWEATPGPDAYFEFLDSTDANHEFLALEDGVDDPMEQWLFSGGLALLDGYCRDDADALAWLASDSLAQASDGVATIVGK